MTNSADPDQLASSEANWSGSTLFAKTWHVVFCKRRVKCNKTAYCINPKYWDRQAWTNWMQNAASDLDLLCLSLVQQQIVG